MRISPISSFIDLLKKEDEHLKKRAFDLSFKEPEKALFISSLIITKKIRQETMTGLNKFIDHQNIHRQYLLKRPQIGLKKPTNSLGDRKVSKEASQNFSLERATIAREQGASEDKTKDKSVSKWQNDLSSVPDCGIFFSKDSLVDLKLIPNRRDRLLKFKSLSWIIEFGVKEFIPKKMKEFRKIRVLATRFLGLSPKTYSRKIEDSS